jgi:hypothetical protein
MRSITLAALGAALAGAIWFGGAASSSNANAQMYGTWKAFNYEPAPGKRKAGPAPRAKAPYRAVGHGYRPRHYYRGYAYATCGVFHYRSSGRCLDARTTPPDLSGSAR